jgi:hypothetical protein
MRAPPAFQISVTAFGQWRTLNGVLVMAALSSVLAWSIATWSDRPFAGGLIGVCGIVMAAVATSGGILRQAPFSLRWDTQCWHLGSIHSRGHEPMGGGRLTISLDVAGFLLLYFSAAESAQGLRNFPGRGRWLAVQRRGHEPHWHALRCTVYSARPSDPALLADAR